MNENENIVTEQVAENVEQTTEETPKKIELTQDELNDIVGKAKARERAKITKQYERQNRELNDLVDTLKAGTGKENVGEMNDTFKKFYESKGIKIPPKKVEADYSTKDIETLARAEADEIIRSGYDEVVEEVDRLAEIGADKMTAREKAVFRVLAEHRQNAERGNELAKIGVTEEVYNSAEFKEIQDMCKENTPISKVYELYQKAHPKKEFKTTGSMKTTTSDDNGVKEYYTPEEARRFTKKELDENPVIFQNIMKSMPKWKK